MAWLFGCTDVKQHDAAHAVLVDEASGGRDRALNDVGTVVGQRVGGVGATEAVAAFLVTFQINYVKVLRHDDNGAQGRQVATNRGNGVFLDKFESFFTEGHALFLVDALS
ncbi:hypothetical protein D3C76_1276090 [compost metagenome]